MTIMEAATATRSAAQRAAAAIGAPSAQPGHDVVRAAAAGDVHAFEVIVCAYRSRVWRFLRRLLGDADLAEDCTQETFLRVYQRLDTFQFDATFSAWVFTIARNAGIDALRKRQRARRRLMTWVTAEEVLGQYVGVQAWHGGASQLRPNDHRPARGRRRGGHSHPFQAAARRCGPLKSTPFAGTSLTRGQS